MLQVGDAFNPPRPIWDYMAGVWTVGTLEQTASDVPGARAGFKLLSRRNWEFETELAPTLVDASPRFLGGFVREFSGLTHYFSGAYYTNTTTKLRIYRQYAGLPKITEGLVLPTLDACFIDNATLDNFANMSVRGLSKNYKVNVTYYDGTTESFTSTATSLNITVKKPITRIDVYDVANRLQGSNTKLSGGLDDFYLGGPGTYVLLSDAPLTWDYTRTKCSQSIKDNMIEVEFANQSTYAIDNEFTQSGVHGLRCYEAPAEFYRYFLKRWS
jgi:hypothetical protein